MMQFVIIELIIFVVFFAIVMICAALSFGNSPQSAKVERTSPKEDSVDGFGGTRGYDYSYTPTIRGSQAPFPVGLKTERKKTATHKAYSDKEREDSEKPE